MSTNLTRFSHGPLTKLDSVERYAGGCLQVQMDPEAAADAAVCSEEEELMKVWLTVLTEMPYSSTSALRQSKKA